MRLLHPFMSRITASRQNTSVARAVSFATASSPISGPFASSTYQSHSSRHRNW